MNLLLLSDEDFVAEGRARVTGRRHEHLTRVLRAEPGRAVRVGRLGGRIGRARVLGTESTGTELEVEALDQDPPAPLPVQLVLALPRPKVLRRLLSAVTALGVKRIWVTRAARVDKSYFDSPLLAPAAIDHHLTVGLEQAEDTVLPEVRLVRRFRPFVEDELPSLSRDTARWAAHPAAGTPLPCPGPLPATLVVGPETGFDAFERTCLEAAGFTFGHLGPRTLTVETATLAALGRFI